MLVRFRSWADSTGTGRRAHNLVSTGSSSKRHRTSSGDTAQIVSAAVVEYIRSMDVDTALFTIASRAGRAELEIVPREILERLNVINNGTKKTKWTIESIPQGMYLKGERETALGINKFMIYCPVGGTPILSVVFDAGENYRDVMNFQAEWLMVDDTQVSLEGRRVRRLNNRERIHSFYRADKLLLNSLRSARFVGVGLQPTWAAGFFVGFQRMPFEEGAAKLDGFLAICAGAN